MRAHINAERIQEIFHEAIECDPRSRAELLSRACGDDTLMRQEVESLLWSFQEHQDFLQSPVFNLSAAEVIAQVLDESEKELSIVGQRVGPYRLTRQIGRGGMGAVYLAKRDDKQYEQQVAVKLIKRGMDSEEVLRRFRRERQILANLAHPYISRLLDGGITADGRPFFVMEYVEGQPIDEYASTQQLSTRERLEVFLTVCVAVQYAHQHKIIHRDLKPGNILITTDGTPRLLDFGIAKLLDNEHYAQSTAETATALRLLTPEYASPEQLRGRPLTVASDIYTLGIVLYELLTGRRPHEFQSRAPEEILQSMMGTEMQKPSIVISGPVRSPSNGTSTNRSSTREDINGSRNEQPSKLRRELRGDLDNIVLMALRKEPDRRYSSVEKFAEDIRRHLDGLPIIARKDTFAYKSSKFLLRNKAAILSAFLVAMACLVIGVSVAVLTTHNKTIDSIAVLPFVNSSHNPDMEYLSDGITDSLIDSLSRFPRLTVPAHASVFRYKGQTPDPKSAGNALGVASALTGSVTADGENLLVETELFDSSNGRMIWSKQYRGKRADIQIMRQQMVQDLSIALGLHLDERTQKQSRSAYTDNAEAYDSYLKGRYFWNKRDQESLRRGIEYFQQAIDRDPNYALAYSGIADSYSLLEIYGALLPDQAFGAAKIAAARALELDPDLAETHASIALIKWLYEWNWVEADREFKRALELNPQYPTAHHWYGLFLAEMGRFDEARIEVKRALDLDPMSLIINTDMGHVLYYARRYKESLEQYKKTLKMEPNFTPAQIDIMWVYEQLGMIDEWYSVMEKLDWKPGSLEAFRAHGPIGAWRKQLNELKQSQAMALQQPRQTPKHFFEAALLYAHLGEKKQALEMLEKAYQAREHTLAQIKVNPELDSLRSEPRFIALLRQMNLTS